MLESGGENAMAGQFVVVHAKDRHILGDMKPQNPADLMGLHGRVIARSKHGRRAGGLLQDLPKGMFRVFGQPPLDIDDRGRQPIFPQAVGKSRQPPGMGRDVHSPGKNYVAKPQLQKILPGHSTDRLLVDPDGRHLGGAQTAGSVDERAGKLQGRSG